jgi:hypothetical protein
MPQPPVLSHTVLPAAVALSRCRRGRGARACVNTPACLVQLLVADQHLAKVNPR